MSDTLPRYTTECMTCAAAVWLSFLSLLPCFTTPHVCFTRENNCGDSAADGVLRGVFKFIYLCRNPSLTHSLTPSLTYTKESKIPLTQSLSLSLSLHVQACQAFSTSSVESGYFSISIFPAIKEMVLLFLVDKMSVSSWTAEDVFEMLHLAASIQTEKLQQHKCARSVCSSVGCECLCYE